VITCNLCGGAFQLEEINGHLAGAHGQTEQIECWPDGEPVILDRTLQPKDFKDE
jgi:hypothetical protein